MRRQDKLPAADLVDLPSWRAYWHRELELMGLPALDPEQLGEHAQKWRRAYLLADKKAHDAWADMRALIVARHAPVDPLVWNRIDQYDRLRRDATNRCDHLRYLSQAELDYLRPQVWRAIA